MSIVDKIHQDYIYKRRIRVLCDHLAGLIPNAMHVLDVGSGDGFLAAALMHRRPDLVVEGIDVLRRDNTHIPVKIYGGSTFPFADSSFDAVMFVDVLHHADAPLAVMREAARVARQNIIIKDHLLNGFLAYPALRFMDAVGNKRHNVRLTYRYWPRKKWLSIFASQGLSIESWRENLGLYPWPAGIVFDRSLHFISRLRVPFISPGPK
jgi:SAM-dependent methyltransferase